MLLLVIDCISLIIGISIGWLISKYLDKRYFEMFDEVFENLNNKKD